jgi:hypothetical protein
LLILAGSVRDKLGMPLPVLCIVQLPFSVCLSFCLCLLLVISIPWWAENLQEGNVLGSIREETVDKKHSSRDEE